MFNSLLHAVADSKVSHGRSFVCENLDIDFRDNDMAG